MRCADDFRKALDVVALRSVSARGMPEDIELFDQLDTIMDALSIAIVIANERESKEE